MSKPKRSQATLIVILAVTLFLSAAALRRYHANAAAGNRTSAEARPIAPAPPNLATVPAPPLAQPAAVPQTSPTPSPTPTIQTLKFWMYGAYLYPTTIYAQPGPTLIVVSNQTQANVSLNLVAYGASSSAAVVSTLPQGQPSPSPVGAPPIQATGVVNLSVGQYIYYDQNNPTVQGVIVVEAN